MNDKHWVGIVGYGFVGKAIEYGFLHQVNIMVNDPKYPERDELYELVNNCEFIFVAVPTPYDAKTGFFDSSCLDKALDDIERFSSNNKPIVIIKSAVIPSIVREYKKKYKNFELVVSPEYLRERATYHDFVNQKCNILGGPKEACHRVINLFENHSNCNWQAKTGVCTAEEASFIKYMENTYLAQKVIFLTQFKHLYDVLVDDKTKDYNYLLKIHHLDERMGIFPHPYIIPGPDGDYGFGGKCLPKDLLSIISDAEKYGVSFGLLEKIWEINNQIRKNKDWLNIPGAVTNG